MVSIKGAVVAVLSLVVAILTMLPLVLEGSWVKWAGKCLPDEMCTQLFLQGTDETVCFKGGQVEGDSEGRCVIECGYKECKSGSATASIAYFDTSYVEKKKKKTMCSLDKTETLGTVATYVSIAVVVLMGLLTLFHGAALFMADDSMATPKKVARGLHSLVAVLLIAACSVSVMPLTSECLTGQTDDTGSRIRERPSMAMAPVVLGVAVVLQFVNAFLAPSATTPPPAYGAYGTNPGGANYHSMEGAYGKAPADTSPYASSPAGRGGGPLAPPANNYDYSSGQF